MEDVQTREADNGLAGLHALEVNHAPLVAVRGSGAGGVVVGGLSAEFVAVGWGGSGVRGVVVVRRCAAFMAECGQWRRDDLAEDRRWSGRRWS